MSCDVGPSLGVVFVDTSYIIRPEAISLINGIRAEPLALVSSIFFLESVSSLPLGD